jgi:hypothetical protein
MKNSFIEFLSSNTQNMVSGRVGDIYTYHEFENNARERRLKPSVVPMRGSEPVWALIPPVHRTLFREIDACHFFYVMWIKKPDLRGLFTTVIFTKDLKLTVNWGTWLILIFRSQVLHKT